MGIYDRDYYRDDAPTWWDRTASTRASYAVMVVLGLVFVAQVVGSNPDRGRPDQLLAFACLDADALASGQVWRLLTSHLVHNRDALLLVALTIWAVWYFGTRVESLLGTAEYVAFLVVGGLVVSLTQFAAVRAGLEADRPSFGSGPLLVALLALFIGRFPRLDVVFIITMPAAVLAAIVIGLELLGEFGGGFARSGVAGYAAGAVWALVYVQAGFTLTRFLRVGTFARPVRPQSTRLKLFRDTPAGPAEADGDDRVAREILEAYSPRPAPARPAAVLDEHLEAKLDEVLEKVSRSGRDSLTGEEQSILNRASEIYKQRKGS